MAGERVVAAVATVDAATVADVEPHVLFNTLLHDMAEERGRRSEDGVQPALGDIILIMVPPGDGPDMAEVCWRALGGGDRG